QSFGIYQEEPIDIVLEFNKIIAEDVLNYHFHPTQKVKVLDNGNIEVKFKAGGTYAICQELFKWGCNVKILAPKSLKNEYIELLDKILLCQNKS
ncbi:MAG: WYL domain-containing protein, partial [Candidatus Gastranaerophilales bacterium]|nr:WYL domain-containing protein [Candidatus Gastranaerophilales bacterium]